MAVLEKIRVKFGILITILVALALLSFIIDPETLRSAMQMFSSDNEVGEMNGRAVSYKDYYEELNHFSKLAEMSGQSTGSEEAQTSLRDAAWQSIFDQRVFIPAAEKGGLNVCDEEMLDLMQGNAISPVIAQQPIFQGEDGSFSREALVNFVQNTSSDKTGNAEYYWDYLESAVYRQQLYTKYASLLEKSNIKNSVETQRALVDNNVISDVDFVLAPMGYEQDSTITVSASEIKAYYNARKDNMKQLANRDIEYVMFEVVPSQEDIDNTKEEFDALYEEFKTADNVKNFIILNSDVKWDTYYYSEAQLKSIPEYSEYAFGKGAKDAVSAVYADGKSFAAARLVNTKMLSDSANVMYVAMPMTNEAIADSLINVAQKSKAIPAEFNDMGWITADITAANNISAWDACFDPAEGKIIKAKIPASQALFVIYVKERTKPVKKVQLAKLVKNILSSDDTYRSFEMQATELYDKSEGNYNKFTEAVKESNLPVIPLNNMVEGTKRIGVVENAREVTHWVFDKKTKKGDVSEVIKVDNKYYFVVAVTATRKEGYININDVQQQIRMILTNEKKLDKMKGEVADKIKDCTTMEQVADALGSTVSHQNGISFGSMQSQSLDPKFVGAVAGATQGTLCGPIVGEIGVYVFQVADRETGTFYTENDAKTMNSQITSYQMNIMQSVIAEDAEIKDHRAKFF